MISYPNGINKRQNKLKIYGNRGMSLENDINFTNEYYLRENIAVIHKKPTPIQVVKQTDNKIIEAFFKAPSTTDYNGIYKGYYIDFEAKETTSKTSFPLINIHFHQIQHMRKICEHGGIAFLIIRFTKINETYLLFAKDFLNFIDNNSRKSIPIEYIKKYGFLIQENYNVRVDYLKIIDDHGGIYGKKE